MHQQQNGCQASIFYQYCCCVCLNSLHPLLCVCCGCAAACFLTFYDEVLPPQLRSLIPSVGKACLQPYSILQVGAELCSTAVVQPGAEHLTYRYLPIAWH